MFNAVSMRSVIEETKKFFAKGAGDVVADVEVCLARMGFLDITHAGWLTKQGKVVKSWKRRYFILVSPGIMFYCLDDSVVNKLKTIKILNVLDQYEVRRVAEDAVAIGILGSVRVNAQTKVHKLTTTEGKDHVFSIQAPDPSNRVFFFSADSQEEVLRWERAIRDMDDFEERQKRMEDQERAAVEQKKRDRVRDKYLRLLPSAKDAFAGGVVRCGDDIWTYTSTGVGDQHPAIVEMTEGRHKGARYTWNGTIVSDGQIALMGDDVGGWGLWNGVRVEWRTPACLEKRGKGQAWEYKADADWKIWKGNEFTRRMNFPVAWDFTSPNVLKPIDLQMPQDIPAEVIIEGAVPPMVAICCAMYAASRKESVYQVKILREIHAYEREKRLLKEQEAAERARREQLRPA